MFDDPFAPKRGRKSSGILGGGLDIGIGPKSKSSRDKRRTFTRTQKNEIWAQQGGKCAKCHKRLDLRTVEYDHGRAWSSGGATTVKNGRALCSDCHKLKHHEARLKKHDKKRKEPKDPFGVNIFGAPPKRRKSKNPFDIGF